MRSTNSFPEHPRSNCLSAWLAPAAHWAGQREKPLARRPTVSPKPLKRAGPALVTAPQSAV